MIATSLFAATGTRTEVLDRVAAIVGAEAVTLSEVRAELSLEAMLGGAEIRESRAAQEAALGRLIDRRLILQDMSMTPFLMPADDEVEQGLAGLRQQRYLGGRDFAAALRHYGLAESDCRSFLRQRIAFDRYVSFRFRTGLSAEAPEIEAFYRDEYVPDIRERGGRAAPLREVADEIAGVLVERRSTHLLELRLLELRSLSRIETMLGPVPGGAR